MSEHHTLMYIPISMVSAVQSIMPGPNGEPAQCVVVPREPTPEIVGAWWRVKNGHHFHDEPAPTDTSDYAAYRAILAAAQEPGHD